MINIFKNLNKREKLVFHLIFNCVLSIILILSPSPSEIGLVASYTLLTAGFTFLSGWIIGRNQEGVIDFLKILVPGSATIIAAIWLFNTGYLNIRAENLKTDITKLNDSKFKLAQSIQEFKNDSTELVKNILEKQNDIDSLTNFIKIISDSLKTIPNYKKEIAKTIQKNSILTSKLEFYKSLNGESSKNNFKSFLINKKQEEEKVIINVRELMRTHNYGIYGGLHDKPGIDVPYNSILIHLKNTIYKSVSSYNFEFFISQKFKISKPFSIHGSYSILVSMNDNTNIPKNSKIKLAFRNLKNSGKIQEIIIPYNPRYPSYDLIIRE